MIWWALLAWAIAGLLATADITKLEDGSFDFHWEFEWPTDRPLRLVAAGPIVWLLILAKAMGW